jgi:hypothetical protein
VLRRRTSPPAPVGAHSRPYLKIGTAIRDFVQQYIVSREGRRRLDMDVVARQMERDVGDRKARFRITAAFGIDRHHGYLFLRAGEVAERAARPKTRSGSSPIFAVALCLTAVAAIQGWKT